MKNNRKWTAALNLMLGAAIMVALALVGTADHEEAQRAAQERTDMEALYRETDGELGWPPKPGECDRE